MEGQGMDVYYLGVEIGGTKQQIAIGKADGTIVELVCEKVALTKGALSIREWLLEKVPVVTGKYTTNHSRIAAACIGFGGPIETGTGKVLISVQVEGWKDFELKTWFQEQFGVDTYVLNDTVAGGYGELVLGAGRASQNFFYTNIGTGIGGAFFIGRKYYDGAGCGAAYMGNTYIPDPFAQRAGQATRLENICSGAAIESRLRQPGYVDGSSLLMELCGGDEKMLSCRMLGEAAKQGDAFALGEIDLFARSYAIGLGNMMTSVSPDLVAVGGGVANLGEIILEPVRKYVNEVAFISVRGRCEIVQSELADNVVIAGAILYAAGCSKL